MYTNRIGERIENPADDARVGDALKRRIEMVRALIDGDTQGVDVDLATGAFAVRALYRNLVAIVVTQADGTHLLTLTTGCEAVPDALIEIGLVGARDDVGGEALTESMDDIDEVDFNARVDEDPLARAVLECAWAPGSLRGSKDTVSLNAVTTELLRGFRDRRHPLADVADALERVQDHMYGFGAASGSY